MKTTFAIFLLTTFSLIAGVKRPQEPTAPLPYKEEEIRYQNKEIELAGTLTLPFGDGPFPTILLIPGSGPTDRNEEVFGHKPFLVLADHLTREGFAVLRVDKRGVGNSTGETNLATLIDLASDVEEGINYLTKRDDIGTIALIGHSQGGIIAPIVAINHQRVKCIALLAAPGVKGEDVCEEQLKLMLPTMGLSPEEVAHKSTFQKTLFSILKEESDPLKAEEILLEAYYNHIPDMPKEAAEASIKAINNPWVRHFLTYDPAPILSEVKVPTLLMIGEKDLQVPPKQNIPPILAALQQAGNSEVTLAELKDLNHLFQTCQTGSVLEYQEIEETFSPTALDVLTNWLLLSL